MKTITLAENPLKMEAKLLRLDLRREILDTLMHRLEKQQEWLDSGNEDEGCARLAYDSEARKIMQKIDYFYLSFEIEGIDTLQDLLLSSIRHIHYKSFDYDIMSFTELESAEQDQEIALLYNTFKINSAILANNLLNEWKDLEEEISNDVEYILPLSRKKKCVCTMSIAEFVRFIQTCFKYEELNDVVDVLLSMDNDIIEDLICMSNDLIDGDDLFLLEPIDKLVKGEIEDTGKMATVIETEIDTLPDDFDLPKQIDLHSVSCVSMVTFKYLLNTEIRNKIMMENIYKTIVDENELDINITISQPLMLSEYYLDIVDHVNLSIGLMNLINERTHNFKYMLLVKLGSFMKYFRYSNNVFKDAKFMKEHKDDPNKTELSALINERYEILKDSKLSKYYE